MHTSDAQTDLTFVKDIVRRTSQRIDAHAFHAVHWGWIVLVWYPLGNWFWHRGQFPAYVGVGIGAVLLGTILSLVRGARVARTPRVPGGNTFVSRQLAVITFANLVAGFALSWAAPASQLIAGENVPILWGLVYANMAFMMGVAYSRDFLISGIAIFIGCLAAIAFQYYNGYILGPFMGLGMIIPGLRAEARVRQLAAAEPAAASA